MWVEALRRRLGFPEEALGAAAVLAVAVAADALMVFADVVNRASGRNTLLFDLGQEGNLPTWLSSMQFFAVAIGATLLAVQTRGRLRFAWGLFAAIFVYFSADDTAQLHEKIGKHIDSGHGLVYDWLLPIVYAPIFVFCIWAIWAASGDVRRELGTRLLLFAGLAFLVVSTVLDSISGDWKENTLKFDVEVVIEESLKLLGTATLASVLVALFLVRHNRGRIPAEAPGR